MIKNLEDARYEILKTQRERDLYRDTAFKCFILECDTCILEKESCDEMGSNCIDRIYEKLKEISESKMVKDNEWKNCYHTQCKHHEIDDCKECDVYKAEFN